MNNTYTHMLKRYQAFIIPLLIASVSLATIFLGLKPALLRTIQLYEEIKATRLKVTILKEKIQFLENLDDSSLQNQLASLVSAVPITKSPETAIMTLEGIAAQNAVTLGDLSLSVAGSVATSAGDPVQADAKSTIPTFGINFKAYGTTEQLLGFMSLLSRSRRLLRLRQFQFAYDTTPTEISGTLAAYYLPLSTTNRSADSPLKPLSDSDVDLINRISNLQLFLREVPIVANTSEPKANPFAATQETP